ncbi:MAG TPA: GDSL-type esterase/lipase family protein [Acidobacteriota bacterium]|nr:GDSL-type esterase/lipase family protein [Acidobacteriota bacterium]
MSRRRKAFFLIVTLCLGVMVALLLGEGILRLFPGLLPPERRQLVLVDMNNVGIGHPYIGHLHTPNATKRLSGPDFDVEQTTGAFGFRNPGTWPSQADVVVLGDSLVFGYGVPDDAAWPAILSRSTPGLGKVMNLGLVGAGAEQYLRVYQTFGKSLRPKLVVVGIFPGNDFWDAGQFDRWLQEGGQGNYMVWRNYGHFPGGFWSNPKEVAKSFLLRHSYLCNLIVAAQMDLSRNDEEEPKIYRSQDGQEIRVSPAGLALRLEGAQPGSREFEITVGALRELHRQVTDNGSKMLVVIQPSKEEVYMPLLGEEITDASAGLRQELSRLGIEYLDLGPVFRKEAADHALFFRADGHPNERGYRLIAESVARFLAGSLRGGPRSSSQAAAWGGRP